jgi:hypothetical protein
MIVSDVSEVKSGLIGGSLKKKSQVFGAEN